MMGALFGGDTTAVAPDAFKLGGRFFLSIPISYSVYKADARACALPSDKVRCEGSNDLTICAYSQRSCERAYLADLASEEKVTLFPSEAKCSGFTVAGEWSAVLFSSEEECRKAVPATREFVIEKVPGYYGSRIVVTRKKK